MLANKINLQGESMLSDNDILCAREAFKKALEINPKLASAHKNLGNYYWQTGDFLKTIEHLNNASRFNPKDKNITLELIKTRDQLVNLQDKSHQDLEKIIVLKMKNSIKQIKKYNETRWTRDNYQSIKLRWMLYENWVNACPVHSAGDEQKNLTDKASQEFRYTPCPLCKEDRYRVFHHETSGLYPVVKCIACGFLFRNPTYMGKKVHDVYSKNYLKFLSGNYANGRKEMYRENLDLINFNKHTAGFKRRRILDIGCGHGLFLTLAQELEWETYGLDFAPDCINYAQTTSGFKNVAVGNLEKDSFESGYFDVVTLWSVAAHLDKPLDMFRKISRVLRPGGLLLIYTVDAGGIMHQQQLSCWKGFHGNHLIFFSPENLSTALSKTAFTPIEIKYDDRFFKRALKNNKIPNEDILYFTSLSKKQNLGYMMTVLAVNNKK